MTSQTIPESAQQDLEGRSVRDVVAYTPEQVDDAWCRKVLRKILQSLELQYAMQMPHRAITPDTIVFHANGAPLLISDDIDAAPAPDAHQADDLTALAAVIHYAITHELTPTAPLHGRVAGYSAELMAAVDACMDPDPARRPRSVGAVLALLGVVAPGPLAGAVVLPAAASALPPAVIPAPVESAIPAQVASAPPADAPVDVHQTAMPRGRRWAIAAGGGAIALGLMLFVALRDPGASDHTVPQAGATMTPAPAGGAATNVAGNPASSPAGSPAVGASSAGTTSSGDAVDQPDSMTRVAPNPASTDDSVAAKAPPIVSPRAARVAPVKGEGAASGNAVYQLQIKPWGTVYVDGVERGVSPPLTRLALPPGPHTVRITHPKYRESILEFESAPTTSIGKIIVDFEHEAQ